MRYQSPYRDQLNEALANVRTRIECESEDEAINLHKQLTTAKRSALAGMMHRTRAAINRRERGQPTSYNSLADPANAFYALEIVRDGPTVTITNLDHPDYRPPYRVTVERGAAAT